MGILKTLKKYDRVINLDQVTTRRGSAPADLNKIYTVAGIPVRAASQTLVPKRPDSAYDAFGSNESLDTMDISHFDPKADLSDDEAPVVNVAQKPPVAPKPLKSSLRTEPRAKVDASFKGVKFNESGRDGQVHVSIRKISTVRPEEKATRWTRPEEEDAARDEVLLEKIEQINKYDPITFI